MHVSNICKDWIKISSSVYPMQLASKSKGGKEQESIQSSTTPETPYEKVTKTQGNIKHKKAKRSALSQQDWYHKAATNRHGSIIK